MNPSSHPVSHPSVHLVPQLCRIRVELTPRSSGQEWTWACGAVSTSTLTIFLGQGCRNIINPVSPALWKESSSIYLFNISKTAQKHDPNTEVKIGFLVPKDKAAAGSLPNALVQMSASAV